MRQCEGQWSLYIERESPINTHTLCVCANPPRIIVNSESEKYNCLEINTSRELWTDDDDDSVMSGRSRLRSSLQSLVRSANNLKHDEWRRRRRLCCAIEEKSCRATQSNWADRSGANKQTTTPESMSVKRWKRPNIYSNKHRNLP